MSILYKIKNAINKKKNAESCTTFKNSTTKHSMNGSCTLKLSTTTEQIKQEIHNELKEKIKKYINNPEKLLQYIKLKGIKIYKLKNADAILSKIGEEEGFITPQKGQKAIFLNALLKKQIGFSTKEMMIFDEGQTEIYTIARALYKYYGFQRKLPGYDYKSQEIFKKIYSNRKKSEAAFEKCSIKDIFSCKEALARDMESIKFTVELSHEYQNAKVALKKLKESSANI